MGPLHHHTYDCRGAEPGDLCSFRYGWFGILPSLQAIAECHSPLPRRPRCDAAALELGLPLGGRYPQLPRADCHCNLQMPWCQALPAETRGSAIHKNDVTPGGIRDSQHGAI